MACPRCSAPVVAFDVPPELREHAPAEEAAICTRCLRVASAVDAEAESVAGEPPDLAAVDPAFPDGDAGVTLALLCGHLESFALSRASIEALVEHAERAGVDVLAFLDRLDATNAAFDLERRRAALLDLL
ncbi:hypothetical protein SAMN04488066_107134 [Halorubrum aquaticum]|uniref:Small CPxCG-related zinc finger protein n=1 Tax=Halorubrum aquaticum TaxID=387340 RepID=A0A1I3AVG6_9EURY|nr:DUF6276 family protein [Halorubrum aquaticum]SFH53776.1 hypothetical protein SAMN04488066_107134 [Halorubrum aquaticum]